MAITKDLKKKYTEDVVPALKKQFGYANPYEVPKLEKVVLNMGVGEAVQNVKILDAAVQELTKITGQKPVVTRAKKSIATYKLRKGMPIGTMVTLRGQKMYDFLQKLISIALPRIRDFRGVNDKSFDGRGNYSIGLKEQILFPEINYDEVDMVKGMNISIITTAKTDEEAKALLSELGMPFRKK
ncbi:MAG: 50S ribosomal protein L5 [Candidatus Melainabacteria bacterium RIFOXYA12_FULL_32_12]|nr:MAG: 50S ribosomal protein L5 [Candidatus Melainabacteria bacterium RIFOXYA2_FULL_32_9]OGI31776.1 MAG: 50S ribosomal protein L5 [Candidatus Melainabacteria bacterium RIFOXYA12_FULL_32_12]